MKQIKIFIKYSLFIYTCIFLTYWLFVRPEYLQWGATNAEIAMRLPEDELPSSSRIVSTRGITIQASKENVWPWIAQTGQNRGGFNSYYWLENLFGARMVNADKIHPDWQHPIPGDTVYLGKNQPYLLVSQVKKSEYYSLSGWMFCLRPVDSGNTRLVIRYPSMKVKQSTLMSIYYYGLFEPLHFIMEAGMMMGIKQRAEKTVNH